MFGTLTGWGMNDVAIALGLGPTLWAYDLSRMTGGVIVHGSCRLCADARRAYSGRLFVSNLDPRKPRRRSMPALYLLFYFPAMLFFFWSAADFLVECL